MAEHALDEDIQLCAYDPNWPTQFALEAQRIRPVLPPDAAVEHIGSTSVPGPPAKPMLAKPIIDILIGLRPDSTAAVRTKLASVGYEDMGEAGVPGRLYFRRRTGPPFNVHVTSYGGPIWRANLALRDYLLAHPEAVVEYTEAKRTALDDGCNTLLRYSDHKSATVRQLLNRALEWNAQNSISG